MAILSRKLVNAAFLLRKLVDTRSSIAFYDLLDSSIAAHIKPHSNAETHSFPAMFYILGPKQIEIGQKQKTPSSSSPPGYNPPTFSCPCLSKHLKGRFKGTSLCVTGAKDLKGLERGYLTKPVYNQKILFNAKKFRNRYRYFFDTKNFRNRYQYFF